MNTKKSHLHAKAKPKSKQNKKKVGSKKQKGGVQGVQQAPRNQPAPQAQQTQGVQGVQQRTQQAPRTHQSWTNFLGNTANRKFAEVSSMFVSKTPNINDTYPNYISLEKIRGRMLSNDDVLKLKKTIFRYILSAAFSNNEITYGNFNEVHQSRKLILNPTSSIKALKIPYLSNSKNEQNLQVKYSSINYNALIAINDGLKQFFISNGFFDKNDPILKDIYILSPNLVMSDQMKENLKGYNSKIVENSNNLPKINNLELYCLSNTKNGICLNNTRKFNYSCPFIPKSKKQVNCFINITIKDGKTNFVYNFVNSNEQPIDDNEIVIVKYFIIYKGKVYILVHPQKSSAFPLLGKIVNQSLIPSDIIDKLPENLQFKLFNVIYSSLLKRDIIDPQKFIEYCITYYRYNPATQKKIINNMTTLNQVGGDAFGEIMLFIGTIISAAITYGGGSLALATSGAYASSWLAVFGYWIGIAVSSGGFIVFIFAIGALMMMCKK